jgi:sugar phosphate isomerase/epimerase
MFEASSRIRLAAAIEALGTTAREAFAHLRHAGVRGVQWPAAAAGLRPRDLDRGGRRDLATVLRRFELEMSGVDLPIPAEHFGDASRVDRAVAAAEEAIRFAAEFSRVPVCMRLPALRRGDVDGGSASSEAEGAIAAVLAVADRHGVRLADETVPPPDTSSDRALVGLGLDPVALLAGGFDPAAVALERGADVVAARWCDLDAAGVRLPPGLGGRLDVVRYRVSLEIAGFEGHVVIDPRQWNDPIGGVAISVDAWREAASPAEPS